MSFPLVCSDGVVNKQHTSIPKALEVGKSKVLASIVSAVDLIRVHRQRSPCALTWWEEWGALWGFFYKDTDLIQEGPMLMTSSSSTDLLTPSQWGLGLQHELWEGAETFRPKQVSCGSHR